MFQGNSRWYLAAGTLIFLTFVWWLTNYSDKRSPIVRPQPRTLESYRQEFRQPDGRLPNDMELRNILTAKGVPFVELPVCSDGQKCQSSDSSAVVPGLPEIEYRGQGLSSSQREILLSAIRDNLGRQLSELRQRAAELHLERIIVDERMKLQLHFSQEFGEIAADEGLLNDFSESLHDLGAAGLRGATLFIAGKPLGEYMRTLDLQRNREARGNSQDGGANDR